MSEWNDWDDHEMAKQLMMAFDGEALTLLGELDDHILSNFELLISELNRRFDPSKHAEAWKIEFRNRIRKQSQCFVLYAQDIKQMVTKANPTLTKVAQDQWVRIQFTQGLDSPDLKRHVRFGHTKDVNQAISLSVEFEAFEICNKYKIKKQFGT